MKKVEYFICDNCEERHEIEFRAWCGYKSPTDENGFESEETEFIELCSNCHGPTVWAGIEQPQHINDPEDIPF